MYGLSLAESKKIALQLLDEYSVDGYVIPDVDNQDYLARHNAFADVVQMELAKIFPISASYSFSQVPLKEMIVAGGPGLASFKGDVDEDFVLISPKAGSFYVEICGATTALIEVNGASGWETVASWSGSGTATAFEIWRGNLLATALNKEVRLTVDGPWPFQVKNATFYEPQFPQDDMVPACDTWRRYAMPADFLRLDEIVLENGQFYDNAICYKWENNRTLLLPSEAKAQVTVRYWSYPTKITSLTADTYKYQLPPEAARLVPIKVAALMIPIERQALSTRLLELYETELTRIVASQATEPGKINALYSI